MIWLIGSLATCSWGREIWTADDPSPCSWAAIRIVVLRDPHVVAGGIQREVQVCANHWRRLLRETDPASA